MSRNELSGILIAETDEAGDVTWVWMLETGERIPRPVRRRDLGLSLDRFKVAGAARTEIANWMSTAVAV